MKCEGVRKSRRKSKAAHYPKMGQDLFKYLPSEIILNIFLRLPIRTIMSCKCVCKQWLNLLTTPEFVKSHLSKSDPSLAVVDYGTHSKQYNIIEFVDDVDLNCDEHRWNTVINLYLPFHDPSLYSSANGLVFMCKKSFWRRDYIMILSPQKLSSKPMFRLERYGFGVSRMSGQNKVVRVFIETQTPLQRPFGLKREPFECQVYNVGSGSWRGITSDCSLWYEENTVGAFLNGNLHWLVFNGSSKKIYCLELETEIFTTFSVPHPPLDDTVTFRNLSVLWDCLCVCDNSEYLQSSAYKIDIWLMKEYDDEKSWTKEFVIRKVDIFKDYIGYLRPIKVFKDGDILMELGCGKLLYYSSNTKTIQEADDVFGFRSNLFCPKLSFPQNFCNGECNLILICDCISLVITSQMRRNIIRNLLLSWNVISASPRPYYIYLAFVFSFSFNVEAAALGDYCFDVIAVYFMHRIIQCLT